MAMRNFLNSFQAFCVNLGGLSLLGPSAVDVFYCLVAVAGRAVITLVSFGVSSSCIVSIGRGRGWSTALLWGFLVLMDAGQTALISRYFTYLAEHFPVMCASDEFLALPRAQAASRHYHRIENLDATAVDKCLADLESFREEFDRRAVVATDLETLIDLELMKANATGILIEFKESRSWRHNPLLYLKIAFIGLDHALTKPASGRREQTERAMARIQAIPRLLLQATVNIDSMPTSYHQAATAMVIDCRSYLAEIATSVVATGSPHFTSALNEVATALDAFGRFLTTVTPLPDGQFQGTSVEKNLRQVFLCQRSLAEIFQIAVEEWQQNLEQMQQLQNRIDPGKTWGQLYHAYSPPEVGQLDTFALYGREIERLAAFFRQHGFGQLVGSEPLLLCETPTYLRSVRSSASFGAASGAHDSEADRFFLSTRLSRQRGRQAEERLRKRLHREYRFLSAHETIPGHQLLDSVRRNLANPVRRQIESPLFYEGWAYYAESLLAEYGYVEQPIELLVDCKRRLWRAARCQIDIGLTTGRLKPEDAVGLLTTAGFSTEEATTQVTRFRLSPGYQLCYSLGRYEIMQLRERFAPRLDRDRFHQELLEGGQLPFHLAEQRLRVLDTGKQPAAYCLKSYHPGGEDSSKGCSAPTSGKEKMRSEN
jgi:hypothetical protein